MMKALSFAALAAGTVHALQIQASNLTEQTAQSKTRAEAVVKMTEKAFKAYKKYAWGYDELLPLSLEGEEVGWTLSGWSGTLVDALDTLIIQNLTDLYADALAYVPKIDFTTSHVAGQEVSVFETTIRYLGGMTSAYYLDPDHPEIYIKQLSTLGETLSLAWTDNNDVALRGINTTSRTGDPQNSNIAEAGTLIIEFDGLATLTGNTSYRTYGQLSTYGIMNEPKVLPGIPAQGINTTAATPVGDYATFQGGSDSYFEYLLKYALLSGNEDPRYLSEWKMAIDSLQQYLIHKDNVLGLTYPADYSPSAGGLIYVYSHLECFLPGNIILGGAALQNQTLIDLGLALAETCYNSYNSTATQIGPEGFCYIPQGSVNPVLGCNVTADGDAAFYEEHGFSITASDYILRPEVIESYFYAYRITGNTIWQDRAWEAFEAIRKWTKATVAWTGIEDVNSIPPGDYNDLETFFFGELMKYFYLIFADSEVLSLDKYVFNTECHPVPYTLKDSYSTVAVQSRTSDFKKNKGEIPLPSGRAGLIKYLGSTNSSTATSIRDAPADAKQISSSLAASKHKQTATRKRMEGIH